MAHPLTVYPPDDLSPSFQALSTQALPLLARNGCEHLLRVGQLEAQLFEQFFTSPMSPAATTPGATPKPAAPATPSGPPSSSSSSGEQLVQVMEPLCGVLYDVLRPLVVQLQDMDELCELVDILKHEVSEGYLPLTAYHHSRPLASWLGPHQVLGDQLSRRGPGAEALVPTLSRTLADVQARLIFRCQVLTPISPNLGLNDWH